MKQTKAAREWLSVMMRTYSLQLLRRVVFEARAIAAERGATRLGRCHLEAALERLRKEQ